VLIVGAGGGAGTFVVRLRNGLGVFAKVNAADLNVLGDLLQFGKIEPALDRSYPLSGVAEALRYVESCHARGKVTIAVA
jgi:NADPH:quinone reductase-like Zn-dependent oxidoreductase